MNSVLFYFVALAVFVGVVAAGLTRRARPDERAEQLLKRVSVRHPMDETFVSPFDYSFVGLSRERDAIVAGDEETWAEFRFDDILAIEGVRDEVVLRQSARDQTDQPVTPSPAPSPLLRVCRLELQVARKGESEPRVVCFFHWREPGVTPEHRYLRQCAGDLERWHALLTKAMRGETV